MTKPIKKRRVASKRKTADKRAAAKSRTTLVSQPAAIGQPPLEDEAVFVESLIESGEAAPLDKRGKLPPGATHQIVEDETGKLKVVRRRFSMA